MTQTAKAVFRANLCFVSLLVTSVCAQQADSSLSGTVTDTSGHAIASAKVSVKNVSTAESSETKTDANGSFRKSLGPGDYEVTATAEGLPTKAASVHIDPGSSQTVDFTLSAAGSPQTQSIPEGASPQSPPSAPSANRNEPSLEDLGFSKSETQANAAQQALLDKRTHMLRIHQRMGLITTIPLLASLVTSVNAGGKSEGTASRDLHVALGAVTGDLYGITAYYAIRAPRVPGTETRGAIKLHKALAWVHGPGMILTPILGAMAFEQKNNGQKVHGIAAAHGPVAIVTAGAFGAALLSVSVKF